MSAQEIDLSPWAGKDPLTLEEAAYLWAGVPPNLWKKQTLYPERCAAALERARQLREACEAGTLEYERPIVPVTKNVVVQSAQVAGWGGEFSGGKTKVKQTTSEAAPWPRALLSRAALRVYADSVGRRPAFLLDPELPGNGESPPLPKGNPKDWRIDLIRLVIASKEWPPLSIPTSGKATIRRLCIDTLPAYFTASTFDAAWKKAVASGIVRTENHETYAWRD